MKKKVLHVVGARPNFVKAAPVIKSISSDIEQLLIHTGQHYDKKMSDVFFDNLNIPKPTEFLSIGSGTHGEQTAKVIVEMEKHLLKYNPDLLLVYGDVNSTLGSAIAASKLNIEIAHVESGLRSFDNNMPEEVNRLIVDGIADYHFVTEKSGVDNLLSEGRCGDNIFLVGNTMIDSLYKILATVGLNRKEEYALLTLHRPSNVDTKEGLEKIIRICENIEMKILFPMHPRTKKSLKKLNLYDRLSENVNLEILEPVGYFEFVSLLSNSSVVITDSGGIQEETTALRVPCLTLRKNTERPITVECGTNILVDTTEEVLYNISQIRSGNYKKGTVPYLWDGSAGKRIAKIIEKEIL
jgi:UDP-N-acetylglucosamine 2-epimerase (non-hydrolysing)